MKFIRRGEKEKLLKMTGWDVFELWNEYTVRISFYQQRFKIIFSIAESQMYLSLSN